MSLDVSIVRSERDLELFLQLPAALRPGSAAGGTSLHWTRALLDQRSNPFYRHAERALFIARQGGRAIGRIAVHVDHLCNRTLCERAGSFDMLDCVDNPRVAAALFGAAEAWLRDRGAEVARGPSGPTMRTASGLLVEGHGQTPMVGLTNDPPAFAALVEAAGYEQTLDLHAYRVSTSATQGEVAERARRGRLRKGIVVRPLRKKKLGDELGRMLEVLNDLPRLGRTCAPWSHDELTWTVRKLGPIVDPELSLLIESDGVPAAAGIALRNVREILRHGHGVSSSPLVEAARVSMARKRRRVHSARIALAAVRPRFTSSGGSDLLALVAVELLGRLKLLGVEWAEFSLVDPSDTLLCEILELTKARRTKTYRVFQKSL